VPRTVTMARGGMIGGPGILTGRAARHGMRSTGCAPGPKRPGFGLPRSRHMPTRVRSALPAATGGRQSCNLRDGISPRPGRGSQPATTKRTGSEFTATRKSSPMRENGWLTGDGM